MSALLSKLAVAALALGLPCAAPVASPVQSRYVYCNVYASTLCFGIAAGDKATVAIPVDFVLYDIQLLDKAAGSIYVGGHPEAADKSLVQFERDYPATDDAGGYQYRLMKSGEHEILYTAPYLNAPLAQIRLHATKEDQGRLVGDFLRNFRPCRMESAKVSCADVRVFAQLVADRFQTN